MKPDIRQILASLIGADYTTHHLAQLARRHIKAVWNDLSPSEISELGDWLLDRQMAAQGRAQIEWTYIRATFTSIQQAGEP